MKKTKILILVIMLFIMSSCKQEEPSEIVLNFSDELEVHSELKIKDVINETNVDILNQDLIINTNSLGKKIYEVKYKYNNKNYKRNITFNILDTEKPFIYSGGSRTVLQNTQYDFCENLIYGDNYDPDPKCEIIGSYDYSLLGKHNLKIKITDQSGNMAERTLALNVVDKIEKTPPKTSSSLEFSTVIDKHKASDVEFGIDVSSWQEEVDYMEVKNAGASFVMIRLGFQSSSTKELKVDSYYLQNITNAKAAGLKVGVYLYTDSSTIKEAKEHADWVLKELGDIKLDLPIVFDWEDFSNFRKYKLSLYQLNEMANTFIKTVEKKGYQGMLYSSKTYLENFWENKYNYPIWLAHYTNETDYKGDYLMWQLSNTGRIPGINGPVDINIMYKR